MASNKNNTHNVGSMDSNLVDLSSHNPTFSDNEYQDKELQSLRGDAIGRTLYSERFVLNTLINLGKLDKDLQDDEDFERDLCSLWDMTIEEDVAEYLLEHDFLEIFVYIIRNTLDKRLIEILVGILANMCHIQQTRDLLTEKKEVVETLLDLMSCMDSLTLEQLIRLLKVVFSCMCEDQIEIWYTIISTSDEFVGYLCFILSNAVKWSLVFQGMELLSAMLAKFFILKLQIGTSSGSSIDQVNSINFEEVFVKKEVIKCTIEAFKTLVKGSGKYAGDIPDRYYNAMRIFCTIHSILAQHEQLSKNAYEPCNDEILQCFNVILKTMTATNNTPSWQHYEADVLESLNSVSRVLPNPMDFDIFKNLLQLLYKVEVDQENEIRKSSDTDDFLSSDNDDEDNEIDHHISHTLILKALYYILLKSDKIILRQYATRCPQKYCENLLKSFTEPIKTEYENICYLKLKEALNQ